MGSPCLGKLPHPQNCACLSSLCGARILPSTRVMPGLSGPKVDRARTECQEHPNSLIRDIQGIV